MGSHGRNGRPYRRARAHTLAQGKPCHRCGHHIDPSLRWPHPMSGSADHDPPISRGGTTLGPMFPSHLHCNQSYGNGSHHHAAPTQATPVFTPRRRW